MINQNYIIPILCIIILIIILLNREQITKYIDSLKKKYKYLDSLLSSNITYYYVLITIILTLIFINWDLLKSKINRIFYTLQYPIYQGEPYPGTYSEEQITQQAKRLPDGTGGDNDMDYEDPYLGGKLI